MTRISILVTFLYFAIASASIAATVTLDCKITDLSRGGGWIPSIALVEVDTERKTVQLLKPAPDQLNGQVKSAELVRNTAEKMIIRWVVKGTRSKSNQKTVAFNFRALFEKTTGKVEIIAKPLGYSNDFRGKGECEIR